MANRLPIVNNNGLNQVIQSGDSIPVTAGGTGNVTLTGYVKGNGVSAMSSSATIPTTDISGLGSLATQAASAVAITGGTISGVTLDGGTF